MKKRIFYIIAGGTLLFSGGVLAGRLPNTKSNPESAFRNHNHSLRATPNDLYLKSPSGSCTRVTVCTACIASIFQMGVSVGQSKAVSAGGTQYTLWDNPNCNTSGGGQQVALFP